MKILMLLENNFPPDTRVENEINALLAAGHEVHMACTKTRRNTTEKGFGQVVFHRLVLNEFQRKSSVGALVFPLYFRIWRKHVRSLFRKYHFDVIHIHDLQLARIGTDMKKEFGAKFILDLHENWPALLDLSEHTHSFLGRMLFSLKQWQEYERKYVNLADEVIVVVEESADRIASLGVSKERIHIVSNTLNMDEFDFEMDAVPHSKMIFTYGGGVTRHRGLQYVLAAAARVRSDDFEIRIVGSGRYLENLKEQAKELTLGDKVRFYGWQDRKELLKILSESDIALIPHIKSAHTDSTIPHKLFQYLYAEKPILASNCDPIERIVHETRGGFIYRYDDVEQLADIMEKVIPKEYPLGDFAKGKSFVTDKYNWDVDKGQLQELYRHLEKPVSNQ